MIEAVAYAAGEQAARWILRLMALCLVAGAVIGVYIMSALQ